MRYHGATVLVTLLVMLSQSSASFSAEKDLDPSLYDTLIFLNEKLKQINVRYSRNFVILIDQQSDMLEISREVFSLERQEWLPDRFTAFIPLDEVVVTRLGGDRIVIGCGPCSLYRTGEDVRIYGAIEESEVVAKEYSVPFTRCDLYRNSNECVFDTLDDSTSNLCSIEISQNSRLSSKIVKALNHAIKRNKRTMRILDENDLF